MKLEWFYGDGLSRGTVEDKDNQLIFTGNPSLKQHLESYKRQLMVKRGQCVRSDEGLKIIGEPPSAFAVLSFVSSLIPTLNGSVRQVS